MNSINKVDETRWFSFDGASIGAFRQSHWGSSVYTAQIAGIAELCRS